MLEISAKFPHKRAFVTGAASGLGAAICRLLADDRWIVGMCDNRREALAESVLAVDEAGGTSQPFVVDVTDRKAYQKAAKTFLHDIGGVDLLVNNAGVAGGGFAGDFLLADWDWVLDNTFVGAVNGCHYFVPKLKEQRFGHIINVGSMAAIAPVPRMAAYCSAEAALKALSEVLYNELFDYGVGVSVLMAEYFQSQLHERTRGTVAAQGKWLIENAPFSAEEVAVAALQGAARGQLHVVFPQKLRLQWWFSRLLPRQFIDYVRRESEKEYRRVERMRGMGAKTEDGRR